MCQRHFLLHIPVPRYRDGAVLAEFVLAFPVVLVLIMAVMQFAHICMARLVVHYAAFSAARSVLVHVSSTAQPNSDRESFPTSDELANMKYPGLASGFCGGGSIGAPLGGAPRSEAEYVANEVAARVCSVVTMGEAESETDMREQAQPGDVRQFGAARRKTRTTVEFPENPWTAVVRVEHDFALVLPVVGPMIAWGVSLWGGNAYQRAASGEWLDTTLEAHKGRDEPYFPHLRLTETAVIIKPWHTMISSLNIWKGHP